jgi:hypothetical protein
LRFAHDDACMTKRNTLLIASAAAAAMVVAGVVAASAAGARSNGPGTVFLAAASPTPGFKSNETSAHEAAEPAAQETAENNGTFRPAGAGGAHSNETSAHETGETAAQEAAENARASGTPTSTH